MKAGMSLVHDETGRIVSARFMGAPDQCLQVKLPIEDNLIKFCILAYPHDTQPHDYQGEVDA